LPARRPLSDRLAAAGADTSPGARRMPPLPRNSYGKQDVMNSRRPSFAASLTLHRCVALALVIGFGIDALHGALADIGTTARINLGGPEIAHGSAAVAPLAAPVTPVSDAVLAQVAPTELGPRLPPVLPPSVAVAPQSAPTASQQLQIQNYRNQLELSQQPSAALTPQTFRDQLDAGEQLNQLDQLNRQSR
jgi:hypothetical protein